MPQACLHHNSRLVKEISPRKCDNGCGAWSVAALGNWAWRPPYGAALFGTLITVVLDRGELQLESIRIPIEMFFAALSLLLLVAWLAQDLTKRAQIAQFQAIAEMQLTCRFSSDHRLLENSASRHG